MEKFDLEFKKARLLLNLGENLTNLLEERGLGMNEVAKKLGIHRSELWRYKNGVSMPSVRTLVDLAVIFDVSIDYLLHCPSNFESLQKCNGYKVV